MVLCDRTIKRFCNTNMQEWFEENFKELSSEYGNPYSDCGIVTPYNADAIDDIAIELHIGKVAELVSPVEGQRLSVITYHNGTFHSYAQINEKIDLSRYTEEKRPGWSHRLEVPANACMLVSTAERVQIPPNCYGQLAVRSSYARQFLGHMLSNIVQPTFCGDITLEFYTQSRAVEIALDQPVIKMLLQESQVPERPYYSRKSHYMNQSSQLHSLMK